MSEQRVGFGFDAHRFADGRPLILGGVRLDHPRGLAGWSDADALLHAIADAVLGAAALGDIGRHFPPADPAWKDSDSRRILAAAVALVARDGWTVENVDATVLAEAPRIGPHADAMRAEIAAACAIELERVSVKATTMEGMGFIGREEGIAATAVALLSREQRT
ncbi:MAG TPA: 2-C-methyl-D-erythritol 2,4-cyclodiphosphate synthase [Gemmatimonadota bacterium]|nr:2-C-methyl-D-erythritol 2,4-cyclodiphosphate synthase [Gemmatimonadota bacterium]